MKSFKTEPRMYQEKNIDAVLAELKLQLRLTPQKQVNWDAYLKSLPKRPKPKIHKQLGCDIIIERRVVHNEIIIPQVKRFNVEWVG